MGFAGLLSPLIAAGAIGSVAGAQSDAQLASRVSSNVARDTDAALATVGEFAGRTCDEAARRALATPARQAAKDVARTTGDASARVVGVSRAIDACTLEVRTLHVA